MSSPSELYPKKVDLTNCDKEPIHILGKVQDHGVLLVCDSAKAITQHSDNIDKLFSSDESIIGKKITDLVHPELAEKLENCFAERNPTPVELNIENSKWLLIYHKNSQGLCLLEFEPLDETTSALVQQQELSTVVTGLSAAKNEDEMCQITAKLIKQFMGYDRVMVYQFDADWNGTVVAEEREEHLESWLGLHYPSTDIPQQARKLFLKQGERIIVDVNSTPVPISPELSPVTNSPVDLSNSELRAVSPIHIEYLRNMGVGGTFTAAIVANGTLWGLIACHHYSSKFLNYYKRLYVKFLTQVFSAQLVLRQSNTTLQKINKSSDVRSKLIEQVSNHWDLHGGLIEDELNILGICDAHGAALILENKISLVGTTPTKKQIKTLINHIENDISDDVFYTSEISKILPEAKEYKEQASGVMAVLMGVDRKRGDAILWFKPEVLQTVTWAGNPEKPVDVEGERLSPRKSFEKWSVEQSGKSLPWEDHEIAAAAALKKSLSDIIIEKYEEVRELNKKLREAYDELETFSYSISHDLRAPLRGIDGFAQIIKEDYFTSLDEFGKSAIETIISSTKKMNELIDDILAFSGLSQKRPQRITLQMNVIIKEALSLLNLQNDYPDTEIKVQEDMPLFQGDKSLVIQLMANLLGNALKYTSKKENPLIEVGYTGGVYFVKDNGIGFKNEHADKIFGVFNRLVGAEYPGSGIGLAIAHRVVEKHNGKIWVESEEGVGTTFYFTLTA